MLDIVIEMAAEYLATATDRINGAVPSLLLSILSCVGYTVCLIQQSNRPRTNDRIQLIKRDSLMQSNESMFQSLHPGDRHGQQSWPLTPIIYHAIPLRARLWASGGLDTVGKILQSIGA